MTERMAAAVAPPAATGINPAIPPSDLNTYRLKTVTDRLLLQMQAGRINKPNETSSLCISLARGIDYSVSNNEGPNRVVMLPYLLKQLCQRRNILYLDSAVMVLMLSAKNACKTGWFSEKETQELLDLAIEMEKGFCSPGDNILGSTGSESIISTIMSRFYPLMEMGQILASLEVKPGYDAYAIDFHISKNIRRSPEEKIRLFVAETDNTDTTACIVSPQQVNFLMNGKGVDRRTNVFMDNGPQLPSNVTHMLKFGTNLLQAIGEFTGDYIIVVAFMSVKPLGDDVSIQDYVRDDVAVDPDSDIIEGPSRISLNCPISYSRIKIPVKGCNCKHLQCFDFSNYVDINSRRPSWRCPHCAQHVCFPDIRVDQNMVKVLSEVGDNIADVIISADGSWKAVLESDDEVDTSHQVVSQTEGLEQEELGTNSIVDLTAVDDQMDVDVSGDIRDMKPVLYTAESQPAVGTLPMPSQLNSRSDVNWIHTSQTAAALWSDLNLGNVSAAFSTTAGAPMAIGNSAHSSANVAPFAIVTDAVTPSLNHSVRQSQFSLPGNSTVHQSQLGNSTVIDKYGGLQHMPNYGNRNHIPAQPFTVPSQASMPQQRPISGSIPMSSAPTFSSSQVAQSRMLKGHHPFPQSPTYPTMQIPQNWSLQNHAHRVPSILDPQFRSHPSLPSSSSPHSQLARAGVPGVAGSQQPRYNHAAHQVFEKIRQPFVPVQISSSGARTSNRINTERVAQTPVTEPRMSAGTTMQTSSAVDACLESSEQNLQPSSRMRGSLSGSKFDAYKDKVIQPTQLAQATQPAASFTPSQSTILPHLQSRIADSRNSQTPQTNVSMPGPANPV